MVRWWRRRTESATVPLHDPLHHPLHHAFDDAPDLDDEALTRLLGGKGAGLVRMTRRGLPVPPGFTLTTDACRRYLAGGWDDELERAVRDGLARLETATGRRLGGAHDPLLVSVRSGAPVSMPGMMDTVLDVGMGPAAQQALAGDPGFAADTARRATASFEAVVGLAPPDDPTEQVLAAVRAVFDSWRSPRAVRYRAAEHLDDASGTAATVQAMVFGNLDDRSGTGVAFSRDPSTGEVGVMGDFLPRAQGEDVVAGDHTTLSIDEMAALWPEQHAELVRIAALLERELADAVDIEFTVERGTLWLLQVRRAKRSPIATFRMAVDMADDPDFPVDRDEAVRRCRRWFDDPPSSPPDAESRGEPIAVGLAASPGRGTGVLCLDPDEAVRLDGDGQPVVLARRATSPADVHGMAVAQAIFTTRGGLVSHAAIVARDWGIPAVVGATEAEITDRGVRGPGGFVPIGDAVTVDGDRGTLEAGGSGSTGTVAPEVAIVRAWAARSDVSDPGTDEAADSAPPAGSADVELLHALRVKGMAAPDVLAARLDRDRSELAASLDRLAEAGSVSVIESRGLWRLSDAGREAHDRALSDLTASVDLSDLPYDDFLALNDTFKELCNDWQLRDGAPNDHLDAEYDRGVLDRLADLDDVVGPLLGRIAEVLPWTARYAERLGDARRRLEGGDLTALTGVMAESYHDVWMELHEDLIVTQGIDRAAEGST